MGTMIILAIVITADMELAWVSISTQIKTMSRTLEIYPDTKEKDIVSFAEKWVELEIAMWNQMSQTQRLHVFSHRRCLNFFKEKI